MSILSSIIMIHLPSEDRIDQGQLLISSLINLAIAATGTVLKCMMRSTDPMCFIIRYLCYQVAAETWWSSGNQSTVHKEETKLALLPEQSLVLTDTILLLTYSVAMQLACMGWWWELKDEDSTEISGNMVIMMAVTI